MTYFQRIKQAREDKGISQQQMAYILGTTRQQVSKYETGAQEITANRLALMCRILGVSSDYILGLTPANQPQPVKQYSII